MRLRRGVAAAALLIAGAVAPAGDAAVAPQLRCDSFDVSPRWTHDRRGVCVAIVETAPGVAGQPAQLGLTTHLTTDGGQSWQPRRALLVDPEEGVCVPGTGGASLCLVPTEVERVVFSANYATDRRIYLLLGGSGLYVTVDDGDTWVLADRQVAAGCCNAIALRPYLDPTAPTPDETPGAPVAYAMPTTTCAGAPYEVSTMGSTARLDPPLHRDVYVAPMHTYDYLFPSGPLRDGPGFAAGFTCSFDGSNFGDHRQYLHACTFALSCPRRVHTFPVDELVTGPWLGPAYREDRPVLFAFRTQMQGGAVLAPIVSRDGGRTFGRWRAAEPLVPGRFTSEVTVATGTQPGLAYLFVRVTEDAAGPEYRLYRSTDSGASFRQVYAARGHRERGPGPAAPWAGEPDTWQGYESQPQRLRLLPDGRLFLLVGEQQDSLDPPARTPRLFCSVDGGRSWSSPCAR